MSCHNWYLFEYLSKFASPRPFTIIRTTRGSQERLFQMWTWASSPNRLFVQKCPNCPLIFEDYKEVDNRFSMGGIKVLLSTVIEMTFVYFREASVSCSFARPKQCSCISISLLCIFFFYEYCVTVIKLQLRREVRLRREYLYRKAQENCLRTIEQKKQKVKKALEGKVLLFIFHVFAFQRCLCRVFWGIILVYRKLHSPHWAA